MALHGVGRTLGRGAGRVVMAPESKPSFHFSTFFPTFLPIFSCVLARARTVRVCVTCSIVLHVCKEGGKRRANPLTERIITAFGRLGCFIPAREAVSGYPPNEAMNALKECQTGFQRHLSQLHHCGSHISPQTFYTDQP